MTESVSTRTKTISDSGDSGSTDTPVVTDRWSNNISYRQLVMSSCVGILQLCWHPYVHDLRKLLPFLFLYNMFSIVMGYPMFYLELALGVVTKKGVLRCWDLAPMARGVGFAMLACCIFSALALGALSAWSLALTAHSLHAFLPWLHCAAAARRPCAARHRALPKGSETPAQSFFLFTIVACCLALTAHSLHAFLPWLHCAAVARRSCAARHRALPTGSETPAQSFFFNLVLDLKREGLEGGFGNVVWELACYYIISWVLIYFIAIKRIYSYSKLVMFKDVLAYFVLLCFAVGAGRLRGAGAMFRECDWSVLWDNVQIWRDAVEYSLIEMTVSQGSLVMLGSYCPKEQHSLGTTALLAFLASKSTTMSSAFILGAAHGALQTDYDTNNTNVWGGSSASMVLWADFVARIPGSQFWSALLFFTMFVLAITSTALLVQTIMSTFTGRSIRKITWAFLIFVCFLFGFIGIITLCTQGGLYILNFLLEWPVGRPRALLAAAVAVAVTCGYGQSTFCEDVYFAVGQYPSVFLRVCWALMPPLLLCIFLSGISARPPPEALAGWGLVLVSLLPILVIMLFYLVFKCRVRNMVGNEK